MCDKAVDTCLIMFGFVPERGKNQEMCDKVVFSKKPFILKYSLNRNQIQKVCDKLLMLF